ncbi:TonB-dependent siderophore receptor [Phreatobacter sp.]|uniref:TonB-dependent receptor plug domain-containing protein n=1 Tax=Phreatobacter sp. TaxID=1966341 RepID=UPI0025D09882|nr:TonB-dependent receptor [Phreatobacter sp.]
MSFSSRPSAIQRGLRSGLLAAGAVAFSLPALAQQRPAELPEITVFGASNVPLEAPRVGASVSVVTAEDIANQGAASVPDVLRLVPGVAVSQSGTPGGLTQVRIRGAEARHTLVVIDGVAVNDVGNGDFNYADFPVADIKRIEVIRGPQSGLYGSNAHSGVINIITKSGRGLATPEATVQIEGGLLRTARGSASVRGQRGNVYGALNIQGTLTDGYNPSRTGTERDGSHAVTASGRFGAILSDILEVDANFRVANRSARYDGFGFPAGAVFSELVDQPNRAFSDSIQGRIGATLKLIGGRWTHSFAVTGFQQRQRDFDQFGPSFSSTGERLGATYRNALRFDTPGFLGASHTVVAGIDFQRETYRYTDTSNAEWVDGRSRQRVGVLGEWLIDLPTGTSLSNAVRHDWNNAFANAFTWRSTVSQRFETGTRLHASVGRGFTAPTFFQLYGYTPSSFVGNTNLKPESSLGWDAGVEQTLLGGKLVADVTYYDTRLSNEFTTLYLSGGRSSSVNALTSTRRNGVEVTVTAKPVGWLSLSGTYTYFTGLDGNGLLPIRRPNHAGSLSATAHFLDNKARLTVSVVHNGRMRDSRFDVSYNPSSVYLGSYTLVGAQLTYDVNTRTTVFARAENILGQRYEEIWSYRGGPFQALAGMRVKLGE